MTRSVAHYDARARQIGERHLGARFEDVHSNILAFLPGGGAVADIGAGVGRDAHALARLGYSVTAVEPSAQMRAVGEAQHGDTGVEWIDDTLPRLAILRAKQAQFDFVLCSAVLMHIPPRLLGESLRGLRAIAKPRAYIAVSLRNVTAGDPAGIFYRHSPGSIRAAAVANGLNVVAGGQEVDKLGRGEVVWRWYVFQNSKVA